MITPINQFIEQCDDMIITNESLCTDKRFNSVKELSTWMQANIKYKPFDTLMSASMIYNTKKGSCHDQCIYELEEFAKLEITPHCLFFIEYNGLESTGGDTHTLVYYEENKKIYWFENSWSIYQGINGPYKNLSELQQDIINKHKYSSTYNRYPLLLFKPVGDLHTGMTLDEYVNACIKTKAGK